MESKIKLQRLNVDHVSTLEKVDNSSAELLSVPHTAVDDYRIIGQHPVFGEQPVSTSSMQWQMREQHHYEYMHLAYTLALMGVRSTRRSRSHMEKSFLFPPQVLRRLL
jgi:hypothetical protein